ncbi:hypothetical protein ACRALDRAFT_1093017 [Sodiomyces alcalophilus JCM 7366]|uniref:uncharacterized protein n=1 Tax=Sodiomyces alcalophilus JCM 7366 TaxID=591952 RepID=UPI0039B4A37A
MSMIWIISIRSISHQSINFTMPKVSITKIACLHPFIVLDNRAVGAIGLSVCLATLVEACSYWTIRLAAGRSKGEEDCGCYIHAAWCAWSHGLMDLFKMSNTTGFTEKWKNTPNAPGPAIRICTGNATIYPFTSTALKCMSIAPFSAPILFHFVPTSICSHLASKLPPCSQDTPDYPGTGSLFHQPCRTRHLLKTELWHISIGKMRSGEGYCGSRQGIPHPLTIQGVDPMWEGGDSDDYPDDLVAQTYPSGGGLRHIHGLGGETVDPRELSLSNHSHPKLDSLQGVDTHGFQLQGDSASYTQLIGYRDEYHDLARVSSLDLSVNTPGSCSTFSASSIAGEDDLNMAKVSGSKRGGKTGEATSRSLLASRSKTNTTSTSKRNKVPVKCDYIDCGKVCGQVFERPTELQYVPCKRHGTVVFLLSSAVKHQKKHNPQVPCTKEGCGERFMGKKERDRHIRVNHPGHANSNLPPEGGTCPWPDCMYKTFTREDNFKRHMDEKHKGLNPDRTLWAQKRLGSLRWECAQEPGLSTWS